MCSGLTARTSLPSNPISRVRQRSPPDLRPAKSSRPASNDTFGSQAESNSRDSARTSPEGDTKTQTRVPANQVAEWGKPAAVPPPCRPTRTCRGSCVATSGTSTQTPPDAEPGPPAERQRQP